MTTYKLDPTRQTLHGKFSRELPPVLQIESGDNVLFSTLDAGWGFEAPHADGTKRDAFAPRDPERDAGHAMCGPIEIRGAQPGMTLAVRINELRPGAYGWTWSGPTSLAGSRLEVGREALLIWTLDATTMTCRDQFGHRIQLRPFMGVMGLPPDEPGLHSTRPPRACGGNIDCKELVAGSTLYLPVTVPGALFSVGDGHAAQGDGEASQTAIECPMELVDLSFYLEVDMPLAGPRADTPAGWITFGFHEDLNQATLLALDDMLDLIEARYRVDRPEALALASIVVDLRITQIANGVHGVHAILPHDAIE